MSMTHVPDLNRSTMSEIRRYKKPSPELHCIIQACLLLLGHDEGTTAVSSCTRIHIKINDRVLTGGTFRNLVEHVLLRHVHCMTCFTGHIFPQCITELPLGGLTIRQSPSRCKQKFGIMSHYGNPFIGRSPFFCG